MGYDPRDRESWEIEFENPKQYVKAKLDMLRYDMRIEPTLKEIWHLESLKTQGDIDRAVHTLINKFWE